MDKLLVLLASSMSSDDIIDKLEQTVQEYRSSPSKETKDNIAAVCALYLTHLKTGGTLEGAMNAIKDFEKFDRREKLFNPEQN